MPPSLKSIENIFDTNNYTLIFSYYACITDNPSQLRVWLAENEGEYSFLVLLYF